MSSQQEMTSQTSNETPNHDTTGVIDMKSATFTRPIVEYINSESIRELDDEQVTMLKASVSGGGYSFTHYLSLRNTIQFFHSIDDITQKRSTYLNVKPVLDYNSVATMDALAYAMHGIYERYTDECVFIEAVYKVTFQDDEGDGMADEIRSAPRSKARLEKSYYQVDSRRLANFMFQSYYNKTYFVSMANEEDRKNTYYYFDQDSKRWGRVGLTGFKKIIKNDTKKIMSLLGLPTKGMIATMNEVANFIEGMIEKIDDTEDDILEQFSKQHPSYVQFKDLVYDMDTHRVAKMSHHFKLKHYHPYRIPTGALNVDTLTPEDGFVDVPITIDEILDEAQFTINRFKVLYKEDQIEFIMSALGNVFYHSANRFQVAIAFVGGGGLGKSFLFNEVLANLLFSGYVSSIDQRTLNNRSNFLFAQLVGKEINIIGELNDSVMSRDIIHMIKSVNSGDRVQIEFKNQSAYNSTLYAKTFMLSNENQLPSMRTADVDDSGFKRRFVVCHCNEKQADTSWQLEYTPERLKENAPAFALACMMMFIKHFRNGNIAKFQYQGGCSQDVVEGFTTNELVQSTREYFKSHDRFRMFFYHLPEKFLRDMSFDPFNEGSPKYEKDIDGFKQWLSETKASYFNEYFKDWHSVQFTSIKGASELPKVVRERYGIERKSKRINGKSVKVYGEPFAEIVESICLEDDPESLRDLIIRD